MGRAARLNPNAQAAKRGAFKRTLPPIGAHLEEMRRDAEHRDAMRRMDPAMLSATMLVMGALIGRRRR